MNPDRLRKAPNIAIVGASSPLGKELRESLENCSFPLGGLNLMETEEYAGLLQEFAGEIRITQIVSPESLAESDMTFFACSPAIIQAYAASGSPFPEFTIDLTQTRRDGPLFLGGVSSLPGLQASRYFRNPHPAALVLARVLARIQAQLRIESVAVTVFEPASERGSAGVDELQEQTIGLLNFQAVENKLFKGQLAFNLLNDVEDAAQTEEVVGRQIRALCSPDLPPPSIAVIQAPVFHSHAFSVFLKLAGAPSVAELGDALSGGGGIVVHAEAGLRPSPVTVVGSDAVHVSRLAPNPDQPGSYFLWLVADNLRLAASNAVRLAESLFDAAALRH